VNAACRVECFYRMYVGAQRVAEVARFLREEAKLGSTVREEPEHVVFSIVDVSEIAAHRFAAYNEEQLRGADTECFGVRPVRWGVGEGVA
jgi:hypothetical protein